MVWIKWYPIDWLHSTCRDDLSTAERATFHDYVCLASLRNPFGQFKISSFEALARQLNTPMEVISSTNSKCVHQNRISISRPFKNGEMVIKVLKYKQYQSFTTYTKKPKKTEKCLQKSTQEKRREEKRREEKKESPKIFSDTHLAIAKLLEEEINERMPKYKLKPNHLEKWANEVRLMEEKKEATLGEIEKVINWLRTDDFWYKNVLSMEKLRKQFGRLWEEANNVRRKKRVEDMSAQEFEEIQEEALRCGGSHPEIPKEREDKK